MRALLYQTAKAEQLSTISNSLAGKLAPFCIPSCGICITCALCSHLARVLLYQKDVLVMMCPLTQLLKNLLTKQN